MMLLGRCSLSKRLPGRILQLLLYFYNFIFQYFRLDGTNPLPYINAARTYLQLGQVTSAFKHLKHGLLLDADLPMSHLDLAQLYLQTGNTTMALSTLDEALKLAKHMSEIRDVLVAKRMATAQLQLEQRGLARPIASGR